VRNVQIRLNRISKNYPAIPKITNTDGVYGEETENAVRKFQSIFSLSPDGRVGRATWYKIQMIYASVKKLSDINSEGIDLSEVTLVFPEVLQEGMASPGVRELQYLLAVVGEFVDELPVISIDGVFGPETRAAVEAYQRRFSLPIDGIVGRETWNSIYRTYRGILASLPSGYFDEVTLLYPGFPLQIGDSGEYVSALQTYLNYISDTYTAIPKVDVDGNFGPATERAVRAFQTQFGLQNTGFVPSSTWYAITEVYRDLYAGAQGNPGQYGGEIS